MVDTLVFFVLAVAVVLGMSLAVLRFLRHKNRLIWREVFSLRKECGAIRNELIDVRKQIILDKEQGHSLLPLLLPSQNGEELLLWNFFGRKRAGFYVDVGAYDGVGFSNTYFFEALGWTGILIEAVPEFHQACLASRPHSKVINAAVGACTERQSVSFSIAEGSVGIGTLSFFGENPQQLERIHQGGGTVRTVQVPLCSLDGILDDHKEAIDFISIDVEGAELEVLQGFDLKRFRPRVLVIEDNSHGTDKRVKNWLSLSGYEERFRYQENVFYTLANDPGNFSW